MDDMTATASVPAPHESSSPEAATLLGLVPDYDKIEGWLKIPEAEALFDYAAAVPAGCIVEIGSYRGRCTVPLCAGSSIGAKVPVFAIDPHEVFTGVKGGSFGPGDRRAFFRTMLAAKLTGPLRLLNTTSQMVTANWTRKVALLFIDGDRRPGAVYNDFTAWLPHLLDGAAVIFKDPRDEGPAGVIKEFSDRDMLVRERSAGSLEVFRYRRPAEEVEPVAMLHAEVASVDPELVIDRDLLRHGLDAESIAYHVYYGNGGKYLYQSVPKCACTTIKTILLEYQGLSIDENEWMRHDKAKNRFPGVNHLTAEEQAAIYQGRTDTFKFVIVRDPYTRMASAYQDKIKMVVKKRSKHWINVIRESAAELGIALSDPITFEEFIRVAAAQPIEAMDAHWRPQFYEGRFGIIKFDYIGHMEMLSSDLPYILERIGAPEFMQRRAAKPHNVTGAAITMWADVSPAIRQEFVKTYAIDFDTLHYPYRSNMSW